MEPGRVSRPIDRVTDTISSEMPASMVVACLIEHGCPDVTGQLELERCGDAPIACGGFGDIFRGVLRSGTRVAIKCPRLYVRRDDRDGRKLLKHIAHELYNWSRLSHPNLLELLGLAHFRHHTAMISPWMSNGNLLEYINRNPSVDRRQIALGVSEGVVYLHQNNAIHGDIKGANVLISEKGIPKLMDFGCTQLKKGTLGFTTTTGVQSYSTRWAAPEILDASTEQSMEADVYALGMELVTGLVPFNTTTKEPAVITIVLLKKKIPERPKTFPSFEPHEAELLWRTMVDSWAHLPENRPRAAAIRNCVMDIVLHESGIDSASDTGTGSDYGSVSSESFESLVAHTNSLTDLAKITKSPRGILGQPTPLGEPVRLMDEIAICTNQQDSAQLAGKSDQPNDLWGRANSGSSLKRGLGARRVQSLPSLTSAWRCMETEGPTIAGDVPVAHGLPLHYRIQDSRRIYPRKAQAPQEERPWVPATTKYENLPGSHGTVQEQNACVNILQDKWWRDTDPDLKNARCEISPERPAPGKNKRRT